MAKTTNKQNFVVDFETYYSKKEGPSATKTGVQNYVTESYAYMMSIVGPGIKWVGTIEEARAKFPASFWNDPGNQFWAANSNFDQAWAQHVWELPRINPWRCILDLGATQQMPHALDQVVRVCFGRKVDKVVRDFMDGKHYKDLSDEEKKRVLDYCMNDSVEEMELLDYLPDASDFEDQVAMLTRLQNRSGVHVDMERVERDRTRLLEHRHNMYKSIPWVAQGGAPLSYQEFYSWCNANGVTPPSSFREKDNPECEAIMKAHPEFAKVLECQRQFRKTNTLTEKIDAIIRRTTPEGVMPLEMIYCGARHTRRWSSRGVNVQNLNRMPIIVHPREGVTAKQILKAGGEDPALEDCYVYPRYWFIPPPGKIFIILDYAQIEPRCLNWLAGNDRLLNFIREGFSVYEAYARSIGAWSGNQEMKVGDPTLYAHMKAEVLGLGYGMGGAHYATFSNTSREQADAAVERFRSKNPMIPKLWKTLDGMIRGCILDKTNTIDIEMPNGEWLRHFEIKMLLEAMPGQKTKRKKYQSLTIQGTRGQESVIHNLWGGVLTENITQRMARDAMAWALVALHRAGFQIVFSSHDEVILAVDDDASKETAMEEATRIMSESPPWAPTLPLGVEGGFSRRYTKM